ncbi:MAG: hypothetical protein HFG40_05370 [Bacilli bacterium]|nr:hypothetical protein [Bacilli bacterium]
MKNSKITRKITQGMYILTTKNGGCVVDAVSQISAGEHPLISVAVMKKNYTCQLLKENQTFALSVLGKDNSAEAIQTFGMNSMRDIDKFEHVKTKEVEGLRIIEESIGYMVCEIIDRIENDTHILFIGKLVEGDILKEADPMSYSYYQENKKDLVRVKTETGKTVWVCTVCGYIYDKEELEEDFVCPKCGVDYTLFERQKI